MTLVLLHSPLLAAEGTWGELPSHLPDDCVVVRVEDDLEPPHARSYVHQAAQQVGGGSVTLVAHSGAGPLVEALVTAVSHRGVDVEGAVFLDAGLPAPGRSRLDGIRAESAEMADELEALLDAGGAYPDWTSAQLVGLVPDPEVVLAALRPRSAGFWREPLPSPVRPAELRGAYVQLSSAYEPHAATARSLGWPVAGADLGHLAMLRDPEQVAALIREVLYGSTTIS